MVNILTTAEHALLREALSQAQVKTSAKISVAVRPFCASYREFGLVYGLAVGSVITLGLWFGGWVEEYFWLLGILLACAAAGAEGMSYGLARLVPQHIRYQNAAQLSMREFHAHDSFVGKDQPNILLFVAVAERYVRVVTNPIVHEHMPMEWKQITDAFARDVHSEDLATACVKAIEKISVTLATRFPPR